MIVIRKKQGQAGNRRLATKSADTLDRITAFQYQQRSLKDDRILSQKRLSADLIPDAGRLLALARVPKLWTI
jgi:hypothetical protein